MYVYKLLWQVDMPIEVMSQLEMWCVSKYFVYLVIDNDVWVCAL